MTAPFFSVERLQLFATDGQLYRAFGYLVASKTGTLLLVPFHLVIGRCDEVLDGCPVPWEDVFAVLEYQHAGEINPAPANWRIGVVNMLKTLTSLGLDQEGCVLDHIQPMFHGPEKVLRLVHPCGVRYAVVMQ